MGSKDIDKIVQQLQGYLQPYLNKQNQYSDTFFSSGQGDLSAGRAGINNLISYYTNLASGSREDLLKNVDVSGITQSFDQAESNLALNGVRGGRNAALLGSLDFEKASAINKIIQQLRQNAPEHLEGLYNSLLGLGTGELSGAVGANTNSLNALQNVTNVALQKKMADDANKTALLGSIFESAGSILGAVFCFTLDTLILVNGQYILAKDVDNEINGVLKNGHLYNAKVIDRRLTKKQIVYEVTTHNGNEITCTKEHYFVVSLNPYVEKPLKYISVNDNIPCINNEDLNIYYDKIIDIKQREELEDVVTFKLNDISDNHLFVTNGLISVDDDIKGN